MTIQRHLVPGLMSEIVKLLPLDAFVTWTETILPLHTHTHTRAHAHAHTRKTGSM